MIAFSCPSCGRRLQVQDTLSGGRGKCPQCKRVVTVPAGNGHAAPAVASDFRTLPPLDPLSSPGLESEADASRALRLLAPPQAGDELGRLGPYRVLAVLGSGGMGVVFRGEDPVLGRPLALKALLPALASSPKARERFLREARAVAALRHDHVVTIYQVGEDRGVPYLAMEYLEGQSLEDRLRRGGALPVPEVLCLGRQAARGLAAAHARGLIHRDVKPANLWLESRGQGAEGGDTGSAACGLAGPAPPARVKILDFGLARPASGDSHLTQHGAILGTPAYMAPEQASGQPVDGRADLFGLGCVLYRACTGRLPFGGADLLATLVAVATQQPPAPRAVNPQVPPGLSRLIERLLAKDPADRPATAREVALALEDLERDPNGEWTGALADVTPVAQVLAEAPAAVPAPKKRRSRYNPGKRLILSLVLGGCLVIVMVGLMALALRSGKDSANREPTNTEAPEPKRKPKPLALADATDKLLRKIQSAVRAGQTTQTQLMGTGRDRYRDVPETGALLIGLEMTYGQFRGNQTLKTFCPIFLTAQGRLLGTVHGEPGQGSVRLEAKPGYAVGAVHVRAGLGVDALSVTFMAIQAGGLNPNDSYDSDWIGGPGGNHRAVLGGSGLPVVGLFGRTADKPDSTFNGLGLVTAFWSE